MKNNRKTIRFLSNFHPLVDDAINEVLKDSGERFTKTELTYVGGSVDDDRLLEYVSKLRRDSVIGRLVLNFHEVIPSSSKSEGTSLSISFDTGSDVIDLGTESLGLNLFPYLSGTFNKIVTNEDLKEDLGFDLGGRIKTIMNSSLDNLQIHLKKFEKGIKTVTEIGEKIYPTLKNLLREKAYKRYGLSEKFDTKELTLSNYYLKEERMEGEYLLDFNLSRPESDISIALFESDDFPIGNTSIIITAYKYESDPVWLISIPMVNKLDRGRGITTEFLAEFSKNVRFGLDLYEEELKVRNSK